MIALQQDKYLHPRECTSKQFQPVMYRGISLLNLNAFKAKDRDNMQGYMHKNVTGSLSQLRRLMLGRTVFTFNLDTVRIYRF